MKDIPSTNLPRKDEPAASDSDLIARIAEGDERAFQQLIRRHLQKTVRAAARITGSVADAEDVAQEAFIRVWKHAGDFVDEAAAAAKFSTWLYRIVFNLCIDQKRKRRFDALDDAAGIVDGAAGPEKTLAQKEQSRRVKDALARLPERQRAAFVLCFYEDHTNAEAADILGVSVKAVESLLVRARRDLRDQLSTEGVEP